MRLPTPPAFKTSESARLKLAATCVASRPRFHPEAPSSYGVSHTLGGLILTDPCDPISCHCRSWGFDPSKHFPLTEPYLPRRQAIPSRRFLQQLRRTTSCALKALYPVWVRTWVESIASHLKPMLPWAFSLPRLSVRLGWNYLSVAHPLMALASCPFSLGHDTHLQRLPPRPPSISHSRGRLPS